MGDYDFILDGISYSYSSLSTFKTCPYAFKLTYIDGLTPRASNFYGEYGTLIHDCMEMFFTKNLELFELSSYYMKKFETIVKSPAPSPPEGLAEKYYNQGITFFDNLSIMREDFDVLLLETKINFDYKKHMMVAKPDLVLKNKKTGEVTLWDYKSSIVYRTDKRGNETEDKEKLSGYYKQLYLYTYALENHYGIKIDQIGLWFIRPEKKVIIKKNLKEQEKTMQWVEDTIAEIYKENFYYNNSGAYFCNNLCGVRMFCEYR